MTDELPGAPPKLSARQKLRVIGWVMACVLLGLLASVGATLFVIRLRTPKLPELTRNEFDEAQSRWDRFGPESYDIQVSVTGRQSATYRVEVRDGLVVLAERNGQPLNQPRTMGTWSVPGMFGTMQSDVLNLEKVASGNADGATPQLTLKAQFHPRFGYPERYLRIQWGSANSEVSWQVTEFEEIQIP